MALGLTFLMLVLVVQIGAAVAAREAAAAAAAAAATRAARPDADLAAERQRLAAAIEAVPGATRVTVRVERRGADAVAGAGFRWTPPGPDWIPLLLRVESRVPVVVPP